MMKGEKIVLSTFILEYDHSNVALRIPVTNFEHVFLFFFFTWTSQQNDEQDGLTWSGSRLRAEWFSDPTTWYEGAMCDTIFPKNIW